MNKNRNGFSIVEGLVIAVIVGTISSVGWYIWRSNQTKIVSTTATTETTSNADSSSGEDEEYNIPDGFVVYENKDLGFKFVRPKDWIVQSASGGCPFDVMLYGSDDCPIVLTLSSKEYAADRRVNQGEGLVELVIYAGENLVDVTTAYNYEKSRYMDQKATISDSNQTAISEQKAFYLQATTDSWKDNVWSIRLPKYYARFFNREFNTIYDGSDGSVVDTINYSSSTPVIMQIVNSTASI